MCNHKGCQNKIQARGYCSTHYSLLRTRGIFSDRICEFDECDNPVASRNLCQNHYRKALRAGAFGDLAKCTQPDCDRNVVSFGLCDGHYNQKRRGQELRPFTKPRYEWSEWYVNAHGYRVRRRTNRDTGKTEQVAEHRLVMEGMIGRKLVAGENVHHLNGNRLDNRSDNLELWSTKQPKGQRIPDKVEFAKEILALYEPTALAGRLE